MVMMAKGDSYQTNRHLISIANLSDIEGKRNKRVTIGVQHKYQPININQPLEGRKSKSANLSWQVR